MLHANTLFHVHGTVLISTSPAWDRHRLGFEWVIILSLYSLGWVWIFCKAEEFRVGNSAKPNL